MNNGGDTYRYTELRPHPEDPISLAAFYALFWTVSNASSELGIKENGDHIAESLSYHSDEPTIHVRSIRTVDNAKLWVDMRTEHWKISYMGVSDAGTMKNPNHAAVNRTKHDTRNRRIEKEPSIALSEFMVVSNAVQERAVAKRFLKIPKSIRSL